MDTLELLRDFIKRRVANPPEEITLESRLEDVGVDSLTLLDLMFDMEDKFGVRMPPETRALLNRKANAAGLKQIDKDLNGKQMLLGVDNRSGLDALLPYLKNFKLNKNPR